MEVDYYWTCLLLDVGVFALSVATERYLTLVLMNMSY